MDDDINDAINNAKGVPDDAVDKIAKVEDLVDREKLIQALSEEADIPKGTIRAELKRREKKKQHKGNGGTTPKPDINQLELSAAAIIDSQNVLDLFEKAWNKIMAGERRNARLLYLMATTRLFDKCMSGAIKGPSSAGKSELRHRVLDFIPPEHVVAFSTLSEKALLYTEDDFCHKILSLGEAAGADEQTLQDYLLRELISAGRLSYPVVQKIGNELITVTIEKNGPVCFFVTTTRAALNPENETRMMSIEVDDSGEQTVIVIDKVAETVGLNAESTVINYEPWRDFQRWLAAGDCSVVVPFARELGKLIPPRSVRLRRDFSQILLAIKAHALIHRNHRQVDARNQIIADVELDYRPVAELMGGIVAEASGTSISKELQQTIDAVEKATAGLGTDQGAAADKIAKLLKLDPSSAWRRLRVAMNKAFVVNLETRHRQPGRYRLTDQKVEAEPLLPSPESVQSAHTRNRMEKAKKDQDDTDCIADCMPTSFETQSAPNCGNANGRAIGRAIANPIEKPKENATDCTCAPIASHLADEEPDPFASLKDPSLKLQDEWDELVGPIPPNLERRRGKREESTEEGE